MVNISGVDFQKQWAHVMDMANAEPVTITASGHKPVVMLSEVEYHRLQRRDRRVMSIDDFTDEEIEAIKKVEPSPESAAFDHEMEE